MIKKFLHEIYKLLGISLNLLYRAFWSVRDTFIKPKEKSILFVAHPDDDVLFFHAFIKENKPYVVLLSDGWSLRRMSEFRTAMKRYGVKYRAYALNTRDTRIGLLEKYVMSSFKISKFERCATHNSTGEYGHEMHIRVHNAVKKIAICDLYVPVNESDIINYPLNDKNITEKIEMFKNVYYTQMFVLDMYEHWVKNEKLVKADVNEKD